MLISTQTFVAKLKLFTARVMFPLGLGLGLGPCASTGLSASAWLIVSSPVHAEETAESESPLAPLTSPRPKPRPEVAPDSSLRPVTRPTLDVPADYRSPPPTASFSADEVGDNCQIYIRSDGTYGEHGLMIRREILGLGTSSDLRNYFLQAQIPHMDALCPKFYELSREERINFWIWYLMSLSHDESKCNDPDWRVNRGAPNGVATGEFQLDEAWKGRSWRGPGCNALAPRVNGYLMTNPENNIPCAVQSLGYSLCGFYSSDEGTCTTEAHAPYGSHLT